MALEYGADIGMVVPLAAVMATGNLSDLAITLSLSDDEVRLRWRDAPPRLNWPEDVTVVRDDRHLLIQFHTGRRDQIDQILRQLASAAQQVTGKAVELEEL